MENKTIDNVVTVSQFANELAKDSGVPGIGLNYFYSALETIRRTHSKLGSMAMALLYKDYWNNAGVLIHAMRSFAEVSDDVLYSFVEMYESIPVGKKAVELYRGDGGKYFKEKYPIFVELIQRGFFVQFTSSRLGSANPLEGEKWERSDLYYKYCKSAIERINNETVALNFC